MLLERWWNLRQCCEEISIILKFNILHDDEDDGDDDDCGDGDDDDGGDGDSDDDDCCLSARPAPNTASA